MSSRGRRRGSRLRAIRRLIVEHRYGATEGFLGALSLALGLVLLWPEGEDPEAEARKRWEQSLVGREAMRGQAPVDRGAANAAEAATRPVGEDGGAPPFDLARASMAVSAQGRLAGDPGPATVSVVERRLVVISETMPEIGPPVQALPPLGAEFAVHLPELAPDEEVLPDGVDEETSLAAAPALRVSPRRLAGHEWLRNAAVEPADDGRPKIAIVIDDLGNNRVNGAALNRLPGPLTLAFLPYAPDLRAQAMAARAAGHELMLHMPMEPVGDEFPGPDALLISIEQEAFRSRLLKNFESFGGFVGINNHMGSLLTADRGRMDMVMAELRRRDLLFLDSKTTHVSVGTQAARAAGVPHAQRDVFLDNIPTPEAVVQQLQATEAIARRNGVAIAIGHPNDVTIQALRRWLPRLDERGFALVPVSTIVALRTCQREPHLAGCSATSEPIRVQAEQVPSSEG